MEIAALGVTQGQGGIWECGSSHVTKARDQITKLPKQLFKPDTKFKG